MPCSRAAMTPVGRCWKYSSGRRNNLSNTWLPSMASMRWPVCRIRYWRIHDRPLVNNRNSRHGDAQRNQRALSAMHDDLVDDHLGEQRQRQAHQLQHQGCGQHIAPDCLVFEQLRHEPMQAKPGLAMLDAIRVDGFGSFGCQRECGAEIAGFEFGTVPPPRVRSCRVRSARRGVSSALRTKAQGGGIARSLLGAFANSF